MGSNRQYKRGNALMGAINVKHTGSGAAIALSSDGTSLLLDGTAIGGGGGSPDLFAESYNGSSTLPSAAGTNSVSIGVNADVAAAATGGFAAGFNADVNNQYAIAGPHARGWGSYGVAFGYEAQSSANHAVSIGATSGANGARNTGAGAVVLGGSHASGADSFAAAIDNNSASYGALKPNSIALGLNAKSNATISSVAIGSNAETGGREAVAIGSSALAEWGSVALGGYFGTTVQARATGTVSFAVAGYNGSGMTASTADGTGSIAMGGGYAQQTQSKAIGAYAHSNVRGKIAWSAYPLANVYGATQTGHYILSNSTTDGTAAILVTDNSWTVPSAVNQVILPNNSAYAFHGTIVARQSAAQGTASAAWKIEGLIRREGSAGTTVLVNSATTVLDNTPSWGMALSADTTKGGLKVEVTGAASTNIRWVATINSSELTYA